MPKVAVRISGQSVSPNAHRLLGRPQARDVVVSDPATGYRQIRALAGRVSTDAGRGPVFNIGGLKERVEQAIATSKGMRTRRDADECPHREAAMRAVSTTSPRRVLIRYVPKPMISKLD